LKEVQDLSLAALESGGVIVICAQFVFGVPGPGIT
jgi:hypothetical protein